MKKYQKILLALGIFGLIAAFLIYFFVYNKPHPDYKKASPAFVLTAAELYQAYIDNRSTAESTYNGKIIQISGRVDDIEIVDTLRVIMFSFETGAFGAEGVRCSMMPEFNEAIDNLEIGDYVTIKGFCSGFNDTDIILENCSLAE